MFPIRPLRGGLSAASGMWRADMVGRLVYVLGFDRKLSHDKEVAAGLRPSPEHGWFVGRTGARLVCLDDVADHNRTFSQAVRRSNLRLWGPPDVVFSALPAYDAVVASGEDVGLPLALHAMAQGIRTPIHIITHGFLRGREGAMRSVRGMDNVHFLCLSECIRFMIIDRFGVPEWRVRNTGWCVDTGFFRPIAEPESPPVIACAGTANRDYCTLMRAVQQLQLELRIAADSAWYPKPLDIANKPLPPGVEVRSYGNYVNLRRLYAQALFVVVPLYPVPNACGYAVISEAMAMGRAVIATKTPSCSDFIVDGETGYYVRPGHAGDLRQRIEHLLANPNVAVEMGRQARLRTEQHFSQECYCRRLEAAVEASLMAQCRCG